MDTGQNPLVVIKVGGSLLDLPDVKERLTRLIEQRPGIRPVLIAGGGATADVVRNWGGTFSLSETACHDLAIQSMSLTASLLTRIVPNTRLIHSRNEAEVCWTNGEWPVLDVLTWWNESAANRIGLPESWDVTSDSLAAGVAEHWHADELWLLKSIDLPAEMNFATATQTGLVDAFFPQIAVRISRICWCNLRAAPPILQVWSIPP